LTLTQTLPLAGAIMVTTPQDVALADVVKGGEMFRQLGVPVLGVIENMSYYLCPGCGQMEAIFGEGGGQRLSQKLNAPLLGQIPLDPAVRAGGDEGLPVVLADPPTAAGQSFRQLAQALPSRMPPPPTPEPAPTLTFLPELRVIS
jgi:ATP-binding protein involved in chromosome partitioning